MSRQTLRLVALYIAILASACARVGFEAPPDLPSPSDLSSEDAADPNDGQVGEGMARDAEPVDAQAGDMEPTDSSPDDMLLEDGPQPTHDAQPLGPWPCITDELGTDIHAHVVIGQPDFTSNAPNRGLSIPGANSFDRPIGVGYADGKLFVSDNNNHRVLIFDGFPTTNDPSASWVVGQADFQTNSPSTSATGFNGPQGLWVDQQWLAVPEWSNHRVSFWPTATITTSPEATVFLGQPDANSSSANNGGLSSRSLRNPAQILRLSQGYFALSDVNNHRVLFFDDHSPSTFAAAVTVLGQSDFQSADNSRPAPDGMSSPIGLASNGSALAVVELGQDELYLYENIPTQSFHAADTMWSLGWGTDAYRMSLPVGAVFIGSHLFVSDRGNDRILVFDGVPTSVADPADYLVGQIDWSNGLDNRGGSPGANTLHGVHFMWTDGCRLVVADSNNNRVLVY